METILKYYDFSRLMNRGNVIDNYIIDEDSIFLEKVFIDHVLIKNCEFKEQLSFKNCRFFGSLTFENCKFEKNISFGDCEVVGAFSLKFCTISSKTIFRNCTFLTFLSEKTIFSEILFCGYIKNNGMINSDIIFDESRCNKISFNDLDCFKNISLKEFITDSIEIYRSVMNAAISFGDLKNNKKFISKNIYIESSHFLSRVDFYNGNIDETLYIHKVEFHEQVVINRDVVVDTYRLIEVWAKYSFSIDFRDNFSNLDLCDCTFDSRFTIYCFEKLSKYEHHVSINFSGIIQGNYVIQDIPTLSIDMSCINYGCVIFMNVVVKFINLIEFYNYGEQSKFIINGIKYNKDFNALIIFDSNLGKTEFINIDFRKFNEVVLVKSDVSNMMLTNSLFPKKIQIKTNAPNLGFEIPEEDRINNNLYFRDSYRQLKLAMEKMGNRYYSLIYRSKEMYYHRKELKWGWDKILLYFNYLSNNNGVSWIRGLFFTLTCALVAFIILNTQLNEPLFYWSCRATLDETFETFKICAENYISYLSTYPVLKIEGLKNNGFTDLIVLLSRIFISIGIYQTITAFRKYSK